jgi:hypothetical protein
VGTLFIFPDTNVFLQCKPLNAVQWGSLGDWEEIEVLLCRPVQTELDALKARGNSRQAGKARTANSLIRELLVANDHRKILCEHPLVHINLSHNLRRDESLAAELDYAERDDQLVGIAKMFQKEHPQREVRLLTDDTGPMASAQAVGLKFLEVPQDWFLPAQADDTAKREKELIAEIESLKRTEPVFKSSTEKSGNVEGVVTQFRPLSEDECMTLIEQLKLKHPKRTEFPTEKYARPIVVKGPIAMVNHTLSKEIFEPPTDVEILEYDDAYDNWVIDCSAVFAGLHDILNERAEFPALLVDICNVGTRPAMEALVVLEAQGAFQLVPWKDDDGTEFENSRPKLAAMPVAPEGNRRVVGPLGYVRHFEQIREVVDAIGRTSYIEELESLLVNPIRENEFCFAGPGRQGLPAKRVEYFSKGWSE